MKTLTVRGYDADVPLLAPDARAVNLLGLDRLGEIDLLDLQPARNKNRLFKRSAARFDNVLETAKSLTCFSVSLAVFG